MASGKKAGATKKRSSTATNIRKREAESYKAAKARQQTEVRALVLFACSVLMIFLVFIKGEHFWLYMHEFLFGLFGISTYLVPFFMLVCAVLLVVNKLNGKISQKIIESACLLFSFTTFVDILTEDIISKNYFEHLTCAFNEGKGLSGGGLIGGVLGYPLKWALSTVGACIVLILVMFVLIFLITELKLADVFAFIKNIFVREKYDDTDEYLEDIESEDNFKAEKSALKAAKKSIGKPEKPEKAEKPFKFDIPVDDIPEKREAAKDATEKEKRLIDTYYDDDGIKKEKEFSDIIEGNALNNTEAEIEPEEIKMEEAESVKPKAQKRNLKPMPEVSSDLGFLPENDYVFPPISLLKKNTRQNAKNISEIENTANRLVEVLRSFGVETRMLDVSQGPTVTRYELQPSAGVKISKITNLADDIALNLAAAGVRIEAPIPNKAAVGIEVPNKQTCLVGVRDIIETEEFKNAKSKLTIALGKDIGGNVVLGDIAKMPHGLIAGSTGSGKSVCINSIIMSILYKSTPDEVKFLLIDPKVVELGIYNGIPHLLVPVVTDPRKASGALSWAVNEMERRYKIFADNNVRDLSSYNVLAEHEEDLDKMPQIVIIIDELADLMMTAPNEVEDSICRIAQKARAAGMHLIIATQRPSVNVVTGLIKANVPSRIAFAVSSQVDSRTILDMAGAEKLLGRGDMLFSPIGSSKPIRVQGCFVSDKEIEAVIDFIKEKHENEYDDFVMEEIERQAAKEKNSGAAIDSDGDEDPMFQAAIDVVVDAGQASTSLLQRKLKLGYARAARIMDELESKGIIGEFNGAKPREVLITKSELLEKRAGEE